MNDIPPGLSPGQALSHYRLIKKVGEGGMGAVWKAFDIRLDRVIALKSLRELLASDPQGLARLQREARSLASINHPNIVTIFSVEEAEDFHFLTMEYVEGDTLAQSIPQAGITFDRFMELAMQIADALHAAHEQGIIHRDLKSSNIMLDRSGRIKVLDFGLAKPQESPHAIGHPENPSLTGSGEIKGTLHYLSPEQLQGKPLDQRSDIFAVGVLFYEMLTGTLPFSGPTPIQVVSAILLETPRPLGEARPDVPQALVDIIERCLQKDPDRRLPSAGDLLNALGRLGRSPVSSQGQVQRHRAAAEAIAVLPLENRSGDPAHEYIADGLTEALINDLARMGSLKVISRTSVMGFKGARKPIRDIARELGVDVLVEGSVLLAGDRVRITAQLIRAESDENLWAGRYDRHLRDVLDLQSEIAQAVAAEVQAKLGRGSLTSAPGRPQIDPQVFLLDLKGRHHFAGRTEQSFRAAMQCFQEAMNRDPSYAPAFVGLADSLIWLVNYGFLPVQAGLSRARAALARALELDAGVPEVHRALALVRWQSEFDWPGAEQAFLRALELQPNSALSRLWHGVFLSVWGRFEEGLVELRRSLELDPLSLFVVAVIGWNRYFARRFEEAIPYYLETLQIDPDFFLGRWYLGEALIELERFDEGIAELQRAVELGGQSSRSLAYLGYGYGRAGEVEEAQSILRQLEERETTTYLPPYFPALVYSGLGEVDRAFEFLQRAVELPDAMARDLKVDPPFEILRPDPRFRSLLRRINLD